MLQEDGGGFSNELHPRGKTSDASNAGSFAPSDMTQEEHHFLQWTLAHPILNDWRQENANMPDTEHLYKKEDGTWGPAREALQARVVDMIINPRASVSPDQAPTLAIVIGKPGSGKSSNLLNHVTGGPFTTINADDIKEMLGAPGQYPEYKGTNAALFHNESGYVAEKLLLPKLFEMHQNITFDGVGKSVGKIHEMIKTAHALGYTIDVYSTQLSTLESAQRAVDRALYDPEHRFVDPVYILTQVRDHPDKTYETLKADSRVHSWYRVHTAGPKGTSAKLVDHGARPGRAFLNVLARDALHEAGRDDKRPDARTEPDDYFEDCVLRAFKAELARRLAATSS